MVSFPNEFSQYGLVTTFNEMQKIEETVDKKIINTQLDIQEASFQTHRVKRILRLFLSIEAIENDGWRFSFSGKLLEDSKYPKSLMKMSFFFDSVMFEINGNELVEWDNTNEQKYGFEVSRKGIFSKIRVFLTLNHLPKKYKLHSALQQILNIKCDTRPNVLMSLWQYIKLNKLQSPDDKKIVNCDLPLKRAFNSDKVQFSELPALMQSLLLPCDPLILEYTGKELECYDLTVEMNDPNRASPARLGETFAAQNDLNKLDQRIAELIDLATKAFSRKQFMQKFADNPVNAINRLVISQSNNLEKTLCNQDFGDKFFKSEEAREAVNLFLK